MELGGGFAGAVESFVCVRKNLTRRCSRPHIACVVQLSIPATAFEDFRDNAT